MIKAYNFDEFFMYLNFFINKLRIFSLDVDKITRILNMNWMIQSYVILWLIVAIRNSLWD